MSPEPAGACETLNFRMRDAEKNPAVNAANKSTTAIELNVTHDDNDDDDDIFFFRLRPRAGRMPRACWRPDGICRTAAACASLLYFSYFLNFFFFSPGRKSENFFFFFDLEKSC